MDIDWAELRDRCRLLEDASILALNKPAGVSVTGERHDSDLVQAARDAGETLYPVHRIDKVTSGVVLLAKELSAHGELTRQFTKRTARKTYLAIVRTGAGLPERGVIELPLSVGRKNRVRIAAERDRIQCADQRWFVASADIRDGKNYPSLTEFTVITSDSDYTALALRPHTGRRHQLRVHLAWIGHPIAGDPLFDKTADNQHTALHSWQLRLTASWRTPPELTLTAPPPDSWWHRLRQPPSTAQLTQAATDLG